MSKEKAALSIVISIHAPRVRCDSDSDDSYVDSMISIHAPRVRCDYFNFGILVKILEFQSTHLV